MATSGGVVIFAYASAPWLFVSYYLRYGALAAYGVIVVAAYWRRRKIVVPAPTDVTRLSFAFRMAAVITMLGLNVFSLAARIPPEGAVDVAFPLFHGTYSVLQGGNSILTNPFHRTNSSERHALDLVKLNPYGARASGLAPRALARYAVFDASVFSPCDGTVSEAVDGVADNATGRANVAAPAGNHVILRCQGVDLLLAHLRQGSIAVRPAERVVRGQLLGRVGNSGNTSEPHLHISASRGGLAVPLTFGGRFLSINDVHRDAGSDERPETQALDDG